MTTLKAQWITYRDTVLLTSVARQNLPPLPDAIVESFRRAFYCGATAVYMSIVKKHAKLADGKMDSAYTFKELQEFAKEMRTPE